MGRGQQADVVKDQFSAIFGNRRGGGRHEGEVLSDEDATQPGASRPGPATPGFSSDGFELDDGSVVEWPEGDGLIRLRDADGESIAVWYPDDLQWEEYAKIFGVCSADFEEEDES